MEIRFVITWKHIGSRKKHFVGELFMEKKINSLKNAAGLAFISLTKLSFLYKRHSV